MANKGVEERRSLPTWFRYAVILVLMLGIFFRFYNLDRKVYWIDEVSTSLRTLGYTKTEVMEQVFTGKVVSAADLQHYQRLSPDKGWADTFNALKGTPEHVPLYFLLSRLWVGWVGHSVATMRGLSALLSLLVFPCLFWLCRELFESPAVAWTALGLVAICPLHVLYAQEARPYSLWTVMTALSSAVLLWAMRTKSRTSWIVYSVTVALGLYTQLLFGLVTIAHGIYIALEERVWQKRLSQTAIAYLLAAGIGCLTLIPWLTVFLANFDDVRETTSSLTGARSFSFMLNRWFLHPNQAFLDRDLGSANLILMLLLGYALYFLCRNAPKRTWLFIVVLVGVSFLALAIPDLIGGGRRSTRIRYLFPYFIGMQIALAYLFATQAIWAKTWSQKLSRLALLVLIVGGIIACGVSSQAVVWWNKSTPRSAYYPILAERINKANNPLIISDYKASDTIAFSYWLKPEVKFQLVVDPKALKIAPGYNPVFLLNPSDQLRKVLTKQEYSLKLLYRDKTDPEEIVDRLWRVKQ
jgi:uncharacterized membrane protein